MCTPISSLCQPRQPNSTMPKPVAQRISRSRFSSQRDFHRWRAVLNHLHRARKFQHPGNLGQQMSDSKDKDLTAHERVCAERYKHIDDTLRRIEASVRGLYNRFWQVAMAVIAALVAVLTGLAIYALRGG